MLMDAKLNACAVIQGIYDTFFGVKSCSNSSPCSSGNKGFQRQTSDFQFKYCKLKYFWLICFVECRFQHLSKRMYKFFVIMLVLMILDVLCANRFSYVSSVSRVLQASDVMTPHSTVSTHLGLGYCFILGSCIYMMALSIQQLLYATSSTRFRYWYCNRVQNNSVKKEENPFSIPYVSKTLVRMCCKGNIRLILSMIP